MSNTLPCVEWDLEEIREGKFKIEKKNKSKIYYNLFYITKVILRGKFIVIIQRDLK